MKTVLFIMMFCCNLLFSQVGINTTSPKATLDIQIGTNAQTPVGIIPPRISADSLQSKDHLYGSDQNGTLNYVTFPVTQGTASYKTRNITDKGYYFYDAAYINPDSSLGTWLPINNNDKYAFAAKSDTNLNLLSLGVNLLGSEFRTIELTPPDVEFSMGDSYISNNQYQVQSTGLYTINYSFRFGQGISAELLSAQRPGLAISKTTSGTTSLLDYRIFGGVQILDLNAVTLPLIGSVNLGVANVSLTQGQISHIYLLNAGDLINFGVITGGLNLSLLGDASAEISIYKIN